MLKECEKVMEEAIHWLSCKIRLNDTLGERSSQNERAQVNSDINACNEEENELKRHNSFSEVDGLLRK